MKDNEEGRTLKTAESPCGERMSASGTAAISDNVALSFLSSPARTRVHRGGCSPHQAALSADAAAAAAAAASETSATKEPELITSDGARGKPGFGNNTPRAGPEPPLVRYRQKNLAKLNRDGRRRLRSAENLSKGASLSPQIELSAEMLNSAVDDTDDKSAILDGDKLAELILRIDPRRNTETIRAEIAEKAAAATTTTTTRNDVESNCVNGVVRSKIIRNPHAKPASTNNFPKSHGSAAAASYPARRANANSETKSGLNGTKLNTRSNDAVGKMRYDGSSSKASLLTSRECANVVERKETGDIARHHDADEELRLPRHDSKIGLVMNSALKRYIRMLKQGLLDHGDKDGVALASLSLSDAISILSEQGTPLSPEEIRELQTVLERIERNPELLCKQSCPSMGSVV